MTREGREFPGGPGRRLPACHRKDPNTYPTTPTGNVGVETGCHKSPGPGPWGLGPLHQSPCQEDTCRSPGRPVVVFGESRSIPVGYPSGVIGDCDRGVYRYRLSEC